MAFPTTRAKMTKWTSKEIMKKVSCKLRSMKLMAAWVWMKRCECECECGS